MSTQKKAKTERVLPTLDQLAELLRMIITIVTKIFKQMDKTAVQYWIGNEKKLTSALKQALCQDLQVVDDNLADWCSFYHEVFGLELNPAEIKLPDEREGFGWIVVVAKGLTRNGVFDLCTKRFAGKTWRYYDDLDSAVTKNDREATTTYAIRVRDRVEADEENKISADTAVQTGIKGMTNLERMLLELWYNWKTKDHLDKNTLTICSGSRYAVGPVPRAYWGGGKFYVSYVNPDLASGNWRVREVVSL